MAKGMIDGQVDWTYGGDDFASFRSAINNHFEWTATPSEAELPFSWWLNLNTLRGPDGSHDRMILGHLRSTSGFRQTVTTDNTDFIIVLPIRGRLKLGRESKSIDIQAGQAAIYQPLSVSHVDTIPGEDGYEACFIHMSFTYARQFLSETLHYPVERDLHFAPVIDITSDTGQFLISIISVLCSRNFADANRSLSAALQRRIIETFSHLLLEVVPHRYTQRMLPRQAILVPHHIRLAQKYLERHVMDQPPIADVARIANVSVRTLEVNFRTYLDMTPRTYQRVLRLRLVREALLSTAETRQISDIARSFGFAHTSRFSKYYASLFGETPSDTRRSVVT
jgi:AraC-like DNA-binding protein